METVKLTINGQEVAAPKGELLIEACEMNGVYLPRFCHHRGLTPQASCRMCVVRVDNPKIPKLQTACTTPVSDGMVVTTESKEVEETRAAMIEFLLSNHPVDCPVCDRAGECELQDQTYGFGEDRTRSQFSDKENFLERQISPFIYNDPQRCVNEGRDLALQEILFVAELGTRAVFAEAVGLVLQLALTRPVANRAIHRMVREQEFDHRRPRL